MNLFAHIYKQGFTALKALTDLFKPCIFRKDSSESTMTDHKLRNKEESDVSTSVSRFGDMTFGFFLPKFFFLTSLAWTLTILSYQTCLQVT